MTGRRYFYSIVGSAATAPTAPPMRDFPPAMIGSLLVERYRLLQPLGEGGFARTYLAADEHQQHQRCVIKHLTLAHVTPAALATARRLFQSEADVLRRLGNHERIPALLDAFEAEGEFYLVQEYIDGEPLSTVFERQAHCTAAEIVAILADVLPILSFIHQQQVVHRDIKPSNLMRRHVDGKLMLIDFGAVKEITTQFQTAASEQFTVSIGTQGYAAPEQMAGRPRYSSDLYSLGMTVIRGLTGRAPTELPENPNSGELLWQAEAPDVPPGLAVFLQRLTHVSVYQRYPSAAAALADLEHVETLTQPLNLDLPDTRLEGEALVSPRRRHWLPGAIAAGVVTAIVLGIRQLGGWVPLELMIYNVWVQRQPDLGRDDRLLLVEITEADLQALQQSTPSDAILQQAIQTLQTHGPRVIGLDLYRDLPQGEGHAELMQTLAADNIIAIRKLGNRPSEAIPAPVTVPPERVGFNDFPVDPDGIIRRSLLFAAPNNHPDTEPFYAFSLRLALAYLAAEDILPLSSDQNPRHLDLDGTVFVPLGRHFGGYQNIDDAGYQIMLQYRSSADPVARLSLSDLLSGQFATDMIRDRIVVIGTTAPSAKDLFYTPYSAAAETDFLMPGVLLHVHATSQILSSVLDDQPLPWALPEMAEILWILLWAASGASLGWRVQRLWWLALGLMGGAIAVVLIPAAVFMAGGWLPVLPASVVFIGTTLGTALSRSYPRRQTNRTSVSTLLTAPTVTPLQK